MILSSIITPVRIYDDYSELDKFKKDCEMCEYELISDKTRLLPIQFQRGASVYPIMKAWLRKTCNDFYTQILPSQEANFSDTSLWVMNGGMLNIPTFGPNYVQFNGPDNVAASISQSILTIGKKYQVKIITSERKISPGQTGFIGLENGGPSILNCSSLGTHTITFTATNVTIGIGSALSLNGDYIRVSEFSIAEINDYSLAQGDFLLPDIFDIFPIGGKDIVNYCGQVLDNSLPCGKYYLVMQSKGNDNFGSLVDKYFFSEVITIKNFVPDQSPYVKIEWYNTCDLQKVKYDGLACDYINRLYVDGPITQPDYPFTEEIEEDGNQNSLPTFQKLEKQEVIIIPKAPEFLIDALTAMRLHDTIKYFECLRNGQEKVDEFVLVESLTYDIDFVLNDCAANVSLKMLLKDRVIDSSCCVAIPEVPYQCCQYSFPGIGNFDMDYGYAMTFVLGVYHFWILNTETDIWEELINPLNGTFACDLTDDRQYYWDSINAVWYQTPNITVNNTGLGFLIQGNVLPSSVFKIKTIYMAIEIILPGYYTAAQLLAGFIVLYADIPVIPQDGEELYVSILSSNAFCDYGESDVETVPFGDE